jgi:uncharacterized membrane protein YkoI
LIGFYQLFSPDEIEFIYNNAEYEYDIDAVTGDIIEKDIDLD